ncbi:hypothetical protein NST99_27100 [Paenibacillus sp. FSL L8-0470]|uniref:hypothetical protein n=1 Tax=Paenibacillus sp. FSL L8-0470 TaxID=2954688 RepID=UPI0030F7A95A
MFNKRWKKVLAWSLSIILVLAIGGLFAANYAVDRLMTSMANGLDLETEDTPNASVEPTLAPTDKIPGEANESNENAALESAAPKKTSAAGKSTDQTTSPESTPIPLSSSGSGKDTTARSQRTSSPATTDVESNPTSSPTTDVESNLSEYSAQVSTDKAKKIQENVTVKDKADVTSIVLGELSLSDIKRLQELASGGLTPEEKREARQIILDKVSADQYNELSNIAKKYGASRGLSHDQVVAEEQQIQAQEVQEEGSE